MVTTGFFALEPATYIVIALPAEGSTLRVSASS